MVELCFFRLGVDGSSRRTTSILWAITLLDFHDTAPADLKQTKQNKTKNKTQNKTKHNKTKHKTKQNNNNNKIKNKKNKQTDKQTNK